MENFHRTDLGRTARYKAARNSFDLGSFDQSSSDLGSSDPGNCALNRALVDNCYSRDLMLDYHEAGLGLPDYPDPDFPAVVYQLTAEESLRIPDCIVVEPELPGLHIE
jgi:hypothetical protein